MPLTSIASLAIAVAIASGAGPDSPVADQAARQAVCGNYDHEGRIAWDFVSTESALTWQATAAALARISGRSLTDAHASLDAWCANAARHGYVTGGARQ